MNARAADVLETWGELAARVALMLELARAGRWDSLPELDAHCAALFRLLQDMDGEDLLTDDRSRALALALRIRADQQQLQELTRPQFVRLVRRVEQLRRLDAQ